ncbi:putative reverse transcriptase domain-containing protein [Tanacetum coccineum]
MMTARKRVGPLPTHRLVVRHSVDYSSSGHFSSDDSSSSLSSSSSSKTSSNPSSDDLSDSLSGHSLAAPSSGMRPSHHLYSLVPSVPRSSAAIFDRPSHDSSSVCPSRKRSKSSAASVPLSSPISGALSYVCADLLPSPKRIRSPKSATDLEVSSAKGAKSSRYRGTELEMDDDVESSDGIDIDPKIQAEIDECIAYTDALRDIGRFSSEEDQGYKIIETGQQSADMLKMIRELERDNKRPRDMIDVASQGVTRSQRRELRIQREMRPIWRFRFYDNMRIARLKACAKRHLRIMPNTRSGASRTRKGINEQIDRRLAGANGRNENRGNGNGGNRNGGANGNGNGNSGGNGYNPGGFVHVARECTYQDFLKCQPLSFNGTKGVVWLTHWFEKMETVFHISNCPEKYQVKYVTCTLLNSALTWWNSYKRIIRIEAAYAMSWAELMKLMTEVYCLRKEIQKMETELWNLADKVERFVRGLPDNIQGNVIAVEPTKLQDAIHIANNLMDQKLKGYARSAKNKSRLENNLRDTRGQQPVFKRQNFRGHNVTRAYIDGNNKKKGYVGSLPYWNKCKLHHVGPRIVRCGNCKRVSHIARDCKVIVTLNTQRASVGNQLGIVYYECGRPGHFRKDCLKLRNQNRGNKTENQTGGNEATTRAYAIGGGGANPDSNVVTGTFLFNNCYASMLFDSDADRSFVSSTFSALLDVAPSTLDPSYAVELADKRISETNVVLRGCTLGLLGHSFDIDLCT